MPEMTPQPLTPVKIDEKTYRIEDNGVRCFLFIGEKKALLVDTGFGNAGSLRQVVQELTNLPVYLVNTHADDDHTGKNSEFECTHIHPAEMPFYYSNPGNTTKAEAIWEVDVIDIGGREFEVVLLPGHTPGSIGLLNRKERFIVTGDSVSTTPVFIFSAVRSIYAHMESMKKLISMKDAYDAIYAAHGDFPVAPEQAERLLTAGEKLTAGELEPIDPPFPIPAKMYIYDGASFFY